MGSHQHTPKMGESSKQVRVDNWGIFFLQRLQMFFNKTDYCDLTLQFEGNVQLKVHRLVMNACTEYFHVLEQTCEIVDDVLIMPSDLQPDVVLPIVNFMYTGMLEFHMSIFDKLYKTANLMNITVLTKLLDAQKTPIAPLPKPTNKRNSQIPHTWNLQGKKITAKTSDPDLPATLPGRKLPVWKRKSAPTAVPHSIVPHFYPEQKRPVQVDPLAGFDNSPKPTRFEWPEEELPSLNLFDSSFDDISYTSKPLLTQNDEPRPSTSFDRVKETPDSSRRSSNYDTSDVDMEDVKDYVKEQKIRSNMNEEDDDDGVDNDFDNCDSNSSSQEVQKRKMKVEHAVPAKRVRFNINEKENQIRPTKINITPTGKTTTSDVDHTRIISEVLKKYPNLVKKNKNIRLKILAKSNNTPVSLEQVRKPVLKRVPAKVSFQSPTLKLAKIPSSDDKSNEEGPWKCQRCSTPTDPVEFVLYYLYRKHMTDVHNEKFDSRMCKFCGHRSTKHNMLMYHQYTKHGVKPPPAYNFPKCSQCPYIALTEALLIKHKMNHTKYELQCVECKVTFTNQQALTSHMQITNHTGKSGKTSYDCQYCTKKFTSGSSLFSHIRLQHRDEARRDGIVSIDEIVDGEEEAENEDLMEQQEIVEEEEQVEYITPEIRAEHSKKEKVKILQDVKLPSMDIQQGGSDPLSQQNIALEPSSEAEALSNVASGIATSLGLVDVVVLDENQQYILHTDNQQGITSGESEFILPDLQDTQTFTTAQQVITTEQNVITQSMLQNSDIGSTDELVMVLTDHDYGDGNTEIINSENSNIVVLYSHPIEGQENQFITSQGNLMLTSQAGLIELRNSNAVVTTTNSQFIANAAVRPESTHIESIEMIQREIDQHPDVRNQIQTSVHDNGELSVATHIQPLTPDNEHKVQVQEEISNVQAISVLQQVEGPEHVEFNTLPDLITVQETTNDQEETEASDKMEENAETGISEETVPVAKDVIEEAAPVKTNISSEDTEAQAQEEASPVQEQYQPNSTETNEPNEPTKDSNQVEEAEVAEPTVEKQDVPDVTTEKTSDPTTEETPMEVDKPEIQTQEAKTTDDSAKEDASQEVDTTEEDVSFHVTADSQEPEIESSSMESLRLEVDSATDIESASPSKTTSDQEQTETPQVQADENPQLPDDNCELQDETSQLQDETSQLQDENSQLQDETSQLQDENSQLQDENSQLQDENSQLQNEASQLPDGNSKVQDDNSELQDETSQLQDENSQLQDETSQLQDVSPQLQDVSPQLQDENSQLQDETSQLQDDNSQNDAEVQDDTCEDKDDTFEEKDEQQDESTDLQDDTSQTSQVSQDLTPNKAQAVPRFSATKSSQSAKIILDDWEDTDSQQSDSKHGSSVTKLIDDWDDDEDDNKKGCSD